MVAVETNLQSLQYQIVNRYIPCYANLKLWGKENTDKCPLCNEVDTIEHFFFQCSSIKCIWTNMSTLFQITYDINTEMRGLDILLGIPGHSDIFSRC